MAGVWPLLNDPYELIRGAAKLFERVGQRNSHDGTPVLPFMKPVMIFETEE